MLRRTKVERADDMGLPPRVVNVRRDYFNESEEEVRPRLFLHCWSAAYDKYRSSTSRYSRTSSASSTRTLARDRKSVV